MKTINISINDCRKCPYYKIFGRSAPGCAHPTFILNPFSVRELPSTSKTDPYNGSTFRVSIGDIPNWCPLEDANTP